MTDDWEQLLNRAQEVADAKGMPKQQMVKAFRRSLRLIDRATTQRYRSARFRWDGIRYDKRETGIFRNFMRNAQAFKYQWSNTKRWGFRYRSMIRRSAETGFAGNLAHLVEDGGWNVKWNKPNRGHGLRRAAFQANRDAAEKEAIDGIREALKRL